MKYCPACKTIHDDSFEKCTKCKKTLKAIEDINEPVALCVVGGPERAMLTGMLTDEDIPFIEQNDIPQGNANEIVTGYDVKLSNIIVLVPYSAIPKAYELIKSLELENDSIEELLPQVISDVNKERVKNGKEPIKLNEDDDIEEEPEVEEEEISERSKKAGRIVFAIIIAIVFIAAIFLTDALTGFIKGLIWG